VDGTPMLFYTSKPSLQQCAAVGDAELIRWERHPDNPLLPDTTHSARVRIGSWRDPFIFLHKGHIYIVVGGWDGERNAPGHSRGIVSLYRSENAELTHWTYLGPLFYHPDSADNACPNFFRLGDKWVLLMSRHNPHVCDYFVGTWDESAGRFVPEYADTLGYTEAVYATQGLYDAEDRLVIWNTLDSHRTTGVLEDWPGCLTLPRLVTLRPDDSLGFVPHPALERLRGRHDRMEHIELDDGGRVLKRIQGDTLEIRAVFELGTASAFGLRVRRSVGGERAVEVRYAGELRVDGTAGVFEPVSQTKRGDLFGCGPTKNAWRCTYF
jgi:sucrose-6-phosphate hydrolase SacC (GH32 family)